MGERKRARKRSRSLKDGDGAMYAAWECHVWLKLLFAHYSPLSLSRCASTTREPVQANFSLTCIWSGSNNAEYKAGMASHNFSNFAGLAASERSGAIWIRAGDVFRDFYFYLRPSPRVSALIKLFYMNHHVYGRPAGARARSIPRELPETALIIKMLGFT